MQNSLNDILNEWGVTIDEFNVSYKNRKTVYLVERK